MSDLTLTTLPLDSSIALITTNGYINNVGGDKIANECYSFIDQGYQKFILDLKNSKVVNSIGISVLLEIIEKLEAVNGSLCFINLDPAIEKTFTIMGLFQYTKKYSSLDEAKANLMQ